MATVLAVATVWQSAQADAVVAASAIAPPVTGQVVIDNSELRGESLSGSFNGGSGSFPVLQGDALGTNLVLPADSGGVAVTATAEAASTGNTTSSIDGERSTEISDSFNAFDGVVTVQQNVGSASALAAATAVATGPVTGPLTAGAASKAEVAGNTASSLGGTRDNMLTDAWNDGATGVFAIQQNSGDGSVLTAATAVLLDDVATAPSGSDLTSTSMATLSGATSVTAGGIYANRIEAAFNGFNGVATIQQNSADNALLSVATTVSPGNLNSPVLSNAALGATVSGTTTMAAVTGMPPVQHTNVIANAFNGARGVVTIQQNNGANSVLQSAVTVSARF